MRALLLFILIGNILVFGSLGIFVFVPKKITIVTEPNAASVSYEGSIICSRTPCDLSLNKVKAKILVIDRDDYKPHHIFLPPLGAGWDSLSEKPIKLEPRLNPSVVARALAKCKLERAKVIDSNNVDAQTCYRGPPVMPYNAKTSGHCTAVFDISETGVPYNIHITKCTDNIFHKPSQTAIKYWIYLPAKKYGKAIIQENVENKIAFRLSDEFGNLIAEPQQAESVQK